LIISVRSETMSKENLIIFNIIITAIGIIIISIVFTTYVIN